MRGFSKSLVNHKVSMAVGEVCRGVPIVSHLYIYIYISLTTRTGREQEAEVEVKAEEKGD